MFFCTVQHNKYNIEWSTSSRHDDHDAILEIYITLFNIVCNLVSFLFCVHQSFQKKWNEHTSVCVVYSLWPRKFTANKNMNWMVMGFIYISLFYPAVNLIKYIYVSISVYCGGEVAASRIANGKIRLWAFLSSVFISINRNNK